MPNLKAVAIVGDPLERQTFYRHFADEIPAVAAQVEIVDLMDLPLAELAKRLAALSDNTAVIYTGIYYTSEGVSYVPAELVTQLAAWANRPLVVNVVTYLNQGAVGGPHPGRNPDRAEVRANRHESIASSGSCAHCHRRTRCAEIRLG